MQQIVFIIILNWNGFEDTIKCVQSCRKLSYPQFQVLVVDNGSTDNSVSQIRKSFPQLQIIENENNLGFAGGNNIGIQYALRHGVDYIWLLNNDTEVEPDTLTELVKIGESNPQIGIVGSKILFYDKPDTLNFAGGEVNLRDGKTRHIGSWEKEDGQYDHITNVDYVTGCSFFIKSNVIQKIGLMPEDYYLYYEETDWCIVARRAGFLIYMAPKSRVFHKVSNSIEYDSPAQIYYLTRNRLFFLKRHGEQINWFVRFSNDIRKIYDFCLSRKFRQATMVMKAYFDWFSNHMGPLTDRERI